MNDKNLLASTGISYWHVPDQDAAIPAEWGAANNTIELAARSLEGIRVVEVKEFDMKKEQL